MKKGILSFVVVFGIFMTTYLSNLQGQNTFLIRNYKQNTSISISNTQHSTYSLSEYGKIENQLTPNQNRYKYIFQGQEYDSDLSLYFFPSRLYSSKTFRFFQPDPKSQYFSPYSYVGGDPANLFDLNGEQGNKILHLYNKDHSIYKGQPYATQDLVGELPDAYHYPLTDFINGKVPNLPEWDGSVFIFSHTSAENEFVEVERGAMNQHILEYKEGEISTLKRGNLRTKIEADKLGNKLRAFSEKNNIPVKSVVMGGCEGETAASGLARGFTAGSTEIKNPFPVKAFNKNYQTYAKGNASIAHDQGGGVRPPNQTRYMLKDSSRPVDELITEEENEDLIFHGLHYEGTTEMLPTFSGPQIEEFARGRIPPVAADKMVEFMAHY